MTDPLIPQPPEVEIVERKSIVAPTEPDWELWYHQHPSSCPHIHCDLGGHCEMCGACRHADACAVMSGLESWRDGASPPAVNALAFFRAHVNQWVGYFFLLVR